MDLRRAPSQSIVFLQHINMRSLVKVRWCIGLTSDTLMCYFLIFNKLFTSAVNTLRSTNLTIEGLNHVESYDSKLNTSSHIGFLSNEAIDKLRLTELILCLKGANHIAEQFLSLTRTPSQFTRVKLDVQFTHQDNDNVTQAIERLKSSSGSLEEFSFETLGCDRVMAQTTLELLAKCRNLKRVGLTTNIVSQFGAVVNTFEAVEGIDFFFTDQGMTCSYTEEDGAVECDDLMMWENQGNDLLQDDEMELIDSLRGNQEVNGGSSQNMRVYRGISRQALSLICACPNLRTLKGIVDCGTSPAAIAEFYSSLIENSKKLKRLDLIPHHIDEEIVEDLGQLAWRAFADRSLPELTDLFTLPVYKIYHNLTDCLVYDPSKYNGFSKMPVPLKLQCKLLGVVFRYVFEDNLSIKRIYFGEKLGFAQKVPLKIPPEEILSYAVESYIVDRDYLSGKIRNYKGGNLKKFCFTKAALWCEPQALAIMKFVKGNPHIKELVINNPELPLKEESLSRFAHSLTGLEKAVVSGRETDDGRFEASIIQEVLDRVDVLETRDFQTRGFCPAFMQNFRRGVCLDKFRTINSQFCTSYLDDLARNGVQLTELSCDDLKKSALARLDCHHSRESMTESRMRSMFCVNKTGTAESFAFFVLGTINHVGPTLEQMIMKDYLVWQDMITGEMAQEIQPLAESLKSQILWQLTLSCPILVKLEYMWFNWKFSPIRPIHPVPCPLANGLTNASCTCLTSLKKHFSDLPECLEGYHLDIALESDLIPSLVALVREEFIPSKPNLRAYGLLDVSQLDTKGTLRLASDVWPEDIGLREQIHSENFSNRVYAYLLLKHVFDITYEQVNQDFCALMTELSAIGHQLSRGDIEQLIISSLQWFHYTRKNCRLTLVVMEYPPSELPHLEFIFLMTRFAQISHLSVVNRTGRQIVQDWGRLCSRDELDVFEIEHQRPARIMV
eukprot:CAMPEP_0115019292 /NCGR_PEP_ID=MMETSP0216-20121206/29351_1 /TAXON_ID=223996 /ORGANISM="Protocruzia adherens, Strain Boccale" /LENGTH=952 /DNA_ID=CAMNT_0002390723 /DNA_START=628 /DNA_END=3486 /DNA_ORIENTATION=+